MNRHKLKAQKREVFGKKLKNMRRQGTIPGVIYGPKFDSLAIQFDLKEFDEVFKLAGETNILEIFLREKESYSVLIKKVQLHPLSDLPLHVDFYKVDLGKKVTAKVPVEFIGESEAVKSGEGVLLELVHEIEVESLPTDIPSAFQVDISPLKSLDDMITITDLKIPLGVTVKLEPEELICKITELMKEEEIKPEVTPEEVEVIKEKKEGETEEETDKEGEQKEDKTREKGKEKGIKE